MSPRVIVPSSGCSWPVSMRNSVDLPAPFGPITPTMPPGGMVKSRFSISSLSPIAFFRPMTSITLPPRRWPFGMMIWALVMRLLSDLLAISL